MDNKGCTPLIIAAQYGRTVLAGFLMGKGARLQVTDKEGDNALHWAAFKGISSTFCAQLLKYHTFHPPQGCPAADSYRTLILILNSVVVLSVV